jgi:hypothetical protein
LSEFQSLFQKKNNGSDKGTICRGGRIILNGKVLSTGCKETIPPDNGEQKFNSKLDF